jgi:hypothetical protein
MATTLTISISHQDMAFLDERNEEGKLKNDVSPSKLFRSALYLYRRMPAFMEIYSIEDYIELIDKMQKQISFLQSEIFKREEKIDSLKNVLEDKIIAERRVSKTQQRDIGPGPESGALEELRRESGEQPKKSEGSS